MRADALRPDDGRAHPFRRKVTRAVKIPNTRTGQNVTLECGHEVMTFGSMGHAPDGVVCDACAAEAHFRE